MNVNYDKLILFGDSITERIYSLEHGYVFGAALHQHFVRRLDILNRGFGGYNSDHGVEILPHILRAEKDPQRANIRLIVIFFGTNDAANNVQHVPLDRYKENLSAMIAMALGSQINVVVVGPALHDLNGPADVPAPRSSNATHFAYSEAAKHIAVGHNVPFVDLWNAFRSSAGVAPETDLDSGSHPVLRSYLEDGLHFSALGYQVFYRELMSTILSNYPEFYRDHLPRKLPPWDSIDPDNITASLQH